MRNVPKADLTTSPRAPRSYLDKRHPPRVICRCRGWNAPKNAALIVAALEAYNSELCSKIPLDGSGRLNEQSAVVWPARRGASDKRTD